MARTLVIIPTYNEMENLPRLLDRIDAEGLGVDCKVGIAQRAERILGLGLVSLIFGAGLRAVALEVVVAVLALASIITVVQRFVYVYRVTNGADQADSLVKGR